MKLNYTWSQRTFSHTLWQKWHAPQTAIGSYKFYQLVLVYFSANFLQIDMFQCNGTHGQRWSTGNTALHYVQDSEQSSWTDCVCMPYSQCHCHSSSVQPVCCWTYIEILAGCSYNLSTGDCWLSAFCLTLRLCVNILDGRPIHHTCSRYYIMPVAGTTTGAALLDNNEATAKSTSQDGGMAGNFG